MNVLFIGGTGTISSDVTKLALEAGWQVTVFNRGHNKDFMPLGVKYIIGDIRNKEEAKQKLKNQSYDVVVEWLGYEPSQVTLDYEIFHGNVGQYIYISSASVYKKTETTGIITETSEVENTYSTYARNKILCEEALMKLYHDHDFPVCMVRPAHTYGKGSIPIAFHMSKSCWTVIDRMLHNKPVIVHGNGNSLWTLTHCSDFAKAFVPLMGKKETIGEIYNIMSDEVLSWDDITKITADALGVEPKIVHIPTQELCKLCMGAAEMLYGDRAYDTVFDTSKIKQIAPDFTCMTSFTKGIELGLEWYKRHRLYKVIDHDYNMLVDDMIERYQK